MGHIYDDYFCWEGHVEIYGYDFGVRINRRHPDEPMGPHGGGWNWKLGIAKGEKSTVVNLITWGVRIHHGRA